MTNIQYRAKRSTWSPWCDTSLLCATHNVVYQGSRQIWQVVINVHILTLITCYGFINKIWLFYSHNDHLLLHDSHRNLKITTPVLINNVIRTISWPHCFAIFILKLPPTGHFSRTFSALTQAAAFCHRHRDISTDTAFFVKEISFFTRNNHFASLTKSTGFHW